MIYIRYKDKLSHGKIFNCSPNKYTSTGSIEFSFSTVVGRRNEATFALPLDIPILFPPKPMIRKRGLRGASYGRSRGPRFAWWVGGPKYKQVQGANMGRSKDVKNAKFVKYKTWLFCVRLQCQSCQKLSKFQYQFSKRSQFQRV